jgi:hypothetical protein
LGVIWNLKILAVSGIAITMLVAGTAWYSYSNGKRYGMQEVQTLWDLERAQQIAAQSEELMKARHREQALQTIVDQQRRKHRAEVNRVVAEYQSMVDGLRNRPEARAGNTGVPESPNAGTGCTGQGLARPDAEFLSRYAADAARLQLALQVCTNAYDQVRREINGE